MRESFVKIDVLCVSILMVAAASVSFGAVFSSGLARAATLAVLVVCTILTATKFGLRKLGIAAAFVAAITAPWNAVTIGGLRPSDVALLLAVACLVIDRVQARRPWGAIVVPAWLVVLIATVVALYLGHLLLPTSPTYLAERRVVDPIGLSTASTVSDLGVAGRWLASLVGVPLLFVLAAGVDSRLVGRLSLAFVGGAVLSALVALTDAAGWTAVSSRFVVPDSGGRQTGLAVHPNHLAATLCLAVPFACWALTRLSARTRLFGAVAIVLMAAGVYVSASRGGIVCYVAALVVTATLLRRLRWPAVLGATAALTIALTIFAMAPQLLDRALGDARLTSADSVVISDQVRSSLAAQGDADFWHSPFFGVGLRVALDAHDIWRQVLAAGGVALAGAFVLFAVGALRTAVQLGRQTTLAYAAAASIATWLLFGTVENLLTDRFLYVPVAIVIALAQPPARPTNEVLGTRDGTDVAMARIPPAHVGAHRRAVRA